MGTDETRRAAAAGARRAMRGTGRRRARSGFTMMELMTVIAILAVVAGVVFVSVAQIQKDMQQRELDDTAKELFIAAQNHLSSADAQGMIGRIDAAGKADKAIVGEPVPDAEDGASEFFFVVNSATRGLLDDEDSVLGQMLPFGAIDETVRSGGTYVIKYDLGAATVLDVFYANPSGTSPFSARAAGFQFEAGDYATLFGDDPRFTGANNKNRQKYPYGMSDVVIGWFGDADADLLAGESLESVKLKVDNAERLKATVTNANPASAVDDMKLTLKLVVTGDVSGKSKAVTLIDKGNAVPSALAYVETTDAPSTYVVCLDDVTEPGGHFADVFGSAGLIPGEDVQIQAVISSSTKLTGVQKSAKLRRNSLFASVHDATAGTGAEAAKIRTARVANIRHLENLCYAVSGYDPSATVLADAATATKWAKLAAKRAVQVSDLSWTGFQEAVNELDPQSVTVCEKARVLSIASDEGAGSFYPVQPADGFALDYDGRSHRISDVTVTRAVGDAGLFDALSGGSVSNLSLVGFDVKSDSGNAGALAGSISGVAVKNVAAFNATGDDAALEITGAKSAGGLVGQMAGGSLIGCAASVYVRSTGGDAGGLVGAVAVPETAPAGSGGLSAASVEASYAGGHTSGGSYSTSTQADDAGRVNVMAANGSAGGLVGASSASLSITSCYATTSAAGDVAGGLVGTMGAGSVSGSYVTGLVQGPTRGAFIGSNAAAVDGESCHYLEMVNEGAPAVGSGEGSATAADADLASYRAFAGAASRAYPYDAALTPGGSGGQAVYPYPTIEQLAGSAQGPFGQHARAHYGDWPAVTTQVVNK